MEPASGLSNSKDLMGVVEGLPDVTARHGIDFATNLLYRTIADSSHNGPFVHQIDRLLEQPAVVEPVLKDMDAAFVVVPGAFYKEYPHTGAGGGDLCEAAEKLGLRSHIVPTESVATCAENAEILTDWLFKLNERQVVLCSLSKGSAEVKYALSHPEKREAFRCVNTWVNVGGTTSGTPMVNWMLERPCNALFWRSVFRYRGWNFRSISELEYGEGSLLDFELEPPAHTNSIHVFGFPLTEDIRRKRTRRWHRRLSVYGPNDGSTVLADCCRLPGLIYPAKGVDHYFEDSRYRAALMRALLLYIWRDFLNKRT